MLNYQKVQDGAPKIAKSAKVASKVAEIYGLWKFMVDTTTVNGLYKPT